MILYIFRAVAASFWVVFGRRGVNSGRVPKFRTAFISCSCIFLSFFFLSLWLRGSRVRSIYLCTGAYNA
ncbi:hypothetical protein QBC38DRAFT_177497 [Podospora fimiseda]|uniref:Uncharacterized protein n=1 Tax=Podospora fimiseda TaxID=252190 RepID=A0AAN7H232_9PEZI|nr:hypothetical protein QBC38DRAFT_177497 [Podospora fimiseda]